MVKVIKEKILNPLEKSDAYMVYPTGVGRKHNAEKSLNNIKEAAMNEEFISAIENIVEIYGDTDLQSYFTDQLLRGNLDLSDLKPKKILRKVIFSN